WARTDDLRDDALEVVRGAELDDDLAAPLAHGDRDAGGELLREQLFDLGERVLLRLRHRRELSGTLGVRRMIEVVADELLHLAGRYVLGGDADGERPLRLGVAEREQRATVAGLDPALGQELL